MVVTANVFVVAPAATVTETGTVAAAAVAAPQRHHRTAGWRSAAERHRARAAVAARHGGRKDAHADQPRIQRQRGVRGRAKACGRDVGLRRDRHLTGGDRERCDCRACSHGDRARGRHPRRSVAAPQRHHRAPDRRRAGECHCAGAIRAADQYGRVHRQGTQQRVHDEPD